MSTKALHVLPICSCCGGCADWAVPPLNRAQAACALGLSIESLFKIRRQYGASYEIAACHRGRIVFYPQHIEKIKEILNWENENTVVKGIRLLASLLDRDLVAL